VHKPQFKTFKVDALLAEHGHSVLYLKPHCPDLNPVELIQRWVQEYITRKNVSFSLGYVMEAEETSRKNGA
jgi:transposase